MTYGVNVGATRLRGMHSISNVALKKEVYSEDDFWQYTPKRKR